jgi:hypothetical protein
MLYALVEGWRLLRRSFGLAVLLLVVNLATALVLAAPLAGGLRRDLHQKQASQSMMYGFDYSWWSQWSDAQSGWPATFGPEIFGVGFAFRNLDLLLKGALPANLLAPGGGPGDGASPGAGGAAVPDPVILGLGLVYLLVQTFLAGGILSTLRGGQGTWTVRGLLHGAGFYFGRFFRVALVALAVAWVVFRLNGPFARWADGQARESVSETTAMAWLLGRHALLLLALLFVNLVSGYAKAIVVVEERSSAILAFLSALSFCARSFGRTFGHYVAVALLGVLLLGFWRLLDGAYTTTGYKTQLLTFALFQAFMLARVGLRVMRMGGQLALYRRLAAPEALASAA